MADPLRIVIVDDEAPCAQPSTRPAGDCNETLPLDSGRRQPTACRRWNG